MIAKYILVAIVLATSFSIACVFAEAALKIPTTQSDWPARRAEALHQWQQIIGPIPPRPPVDVTIVSTEMLADHTRLLIRYTFIECYLLLPIA
jgi:hypothetical protein